MSPNRTRTNAALLERRRAAVPPGPFNIAPLFVDRAEGARLWDVEGREYLDFCGGIGALNVGHCHPRVVEAVRAQAERYLHTCFHVAMYEEYVVLAERLNTLVPIASECRTALFNSGAEAVENAVKIARAHTGRQAVMAFERGFHGRTLLGMTLTGKVRPYSAGFGPFAPEVYRLPYEPFFTASEPDSAVGALEHLAAYQIAPEDVAAVVVEPVLGEGGFLPIHRESFALLREFCTTHGIVLVADEVQTGFGRCGAWFACERYEIEPDLVTLAKSLAAGTVLSAVTGRAEIMDAPGVGGIGGTYGGNPLSCVAALATLDVIESEGLIERAEAIGAQVMKRFDDWVERYAHVRSARHLGAMCGLQMTDAAKAAEVCRRAFDHGLLIMTAAGDVIRTLMPLVVSDEQLARGLDILDRALRETS